MNSIRVEIREKGKTVVSINLPSCGIRVGSDEEADICLPGVEKGFLWRLARHEEGLEISLFADDGIHKKVRTKTVRLGSNGKLGPYELIPLAAGKIPREPTRKLHYDAGRSALVIQSALLIIRSPRGGPEKIVPLPEGLSVIGKDPSCDIVLNDAYVSARHMSVHARKGAVLIKDMGSRNGVFIDDRKIEKAEAGDGQTIRIGETNILLRTDKTEEIIQEETDAKVPGLMGKCEAIKKVAALIGRVAPTEVTVLIEGETGAGKEVVARGIHALSGRREAPFIAVNCSAIPKNLFESELFGHAKGAFTGAGRERRGLFMLASEGTLFLDEIGELPLELQGRLLRALEDRKIRPLGSEREIICETRIIAATNKNLSEMADQNAFRKDLLYRLRMIPIELPPLRNRGEDIALLARAFLETESAKLGKENPGINPSALSALRRHSWPGNVRELKACVMRALILHGGENPIDEDDLELPGGNFAKTGTLKSIEKQAVSSAIRETKTREEAARRLGIAASTLYEKIKKYNIKISNNE